MNFYKRHLGDYAKDTLDLSMIEHGAYTLLLDQLYATEKPLPLDRKQLCRICRAENRAGGRALDRVLTRFFIKTPRGYTNKRFQKELKETKHRVNTAQSNGRKSHGRHPKQEPTTSPDGSTLQTPDSRYKSKTLQPPASREGSGSSSVRLALGQGRQSLIVHKPKNRRLWTQKEKDSLHGSSTEAYVDFFEAKGFEVELLPTDPAEIN